MKKKNYKILLVEDDPNFGMILKDYLELHDYTVILAHDGVIGLNEFKKSDFDICILDVMMPRKDGFTLAGEIKQINKDQPLIFLTAKSLKEDVLKGYKVGADDYLNKPFDSEVLLYKIKAILGRNKEADQNEEPKELDLGKFKFNPRLRILSNNGEEQKLSPKEAELLKLLIRHKNDLLPRSTALLKIWKDDNYFAGRSMDVYVAKLRKYLKQDERLEIQNVHSEGFRLIENV
jgi:DNA-binding response OmpR family regulator